MVSAVRTADLNDEMVLPVMAATLTIALLAGGAADLVWEGWARIGPPVFLTFIPLGWALLTGHVIFNLSTATGVRWREAQAQEV